ncbi:hypothetical protein EB796_010368 [Bugula neritina]|uniref:C2H2-type domain-containing protein n=1 Tax=Bugula neritina TaxID=10212 RepID=A0A7J7K038_BUGNE|nr:hypothetical protein EB796_010368 [Bugula neritina]
MSGDGECKEGAQFKTLVWVEFKQHAWKEHSIDLGMLACDQCDYRATVKSKLLIHQQTHGSEKPFVCEICQKGFKQQAQLKNHSLVHVAGVDVKEKESMSGRHWFVQVACGICKRTFANQKSLQCHIEAVHEKLKPFTCKFCGHKAARKAMMQLHMRTHTGEKPFKCDQCDYVTGDHNSMRRHRMRHSGDKPYKCPHCAYACIQAVSLKLHLKSKHPASDRCFSCPKCPYRTVNKTLFGNHLRDHEIGLIDESLLVPSTEYAQGHAEGAGNFSIKLGAIHDLTNGSANVTQLICSALNAIARHCQKMEKCCLKY